MADMAKKLQKHLLFCRFPKSYVSEAIGFNPFIIVSVDIFAVEFGSLCNICLLNVRSIRSAPLGQKKLQWDCASSSLFGIVFPAERRKWYRTTECYKGENNRPITFSCTTVNRGEAGFPKTCSNGILLNKWNKCN